MSALERVVGTEGAKLKLTSRKTEREDLGGATPYTGRLVGWTLSSAVGEERLAHLMHCLGCRWSVHQDTGRLDERVTGKRRLEDIPVQT